MRPKHFLALLVLPILCLAMTAGAAVAHAATPVAVNCFNPGSWDAAPGDVPCTTVTAPDNDVVRVIQGTASTEEAECVINIANVGDAQCHRVAGNRAADGPVVAPVAAKRYAVASSPLGFALLGSVQEDGSERLGIFLRHSYIHIVCTLSNPVEETAHYTIPCRLS